MIGRRAGGSERIRHIIDCDHLYSVRFQPKKGCHTASQCRRAAVIARKGAIVDAAQRRSVNSSIAIGPAGGADVVGACVVGAGS